MIFVKNASKLTVFAQFMLGKGPLDSHEEKEAEEEEEEKEEEEGVVGGG